MDSEILDTGADYQKAKRSSFVVSFATIALAVSKPAGDGATVKFLDIEIHQPVFLFLLVLLVCIAYCFANYFIQLRREELQHGELRHRYGNLSSKAALDKLEAELLTIQTEASSAAHEVKTFRTSLKKVPQDRPIGGNYNRALDNYKVQIVHELLQYIKHNSMEVNAKSIYVHEHNIHESVGINKSQVINEITETAQFQANEASIILFSGLGINADSLQKLCDDKIPETLKKISTLRSGLTKLSTSIVLRERAFFRTEMVIVFVCLIAAWGFASVRIWKDLRQPTVVTSPHKGHAPAAAKKTQTTGGNEKTRHLRDGGA